MDIEDGKVEVGIRDKQIILRVGSLCDGSRYTVKMNSGQAHELKRMFDVAVQAVLHPAYAEKLSR